MNPWPGAVLFDMDGTLLESHESVERAWTTWAERRGIDATALLEHAHGLPADVTVARWLPDASADRPLWEMEFSAAKARAIDSFERDYLSRQLKQQTSISAAARASGLDRSNFRRLLKRHGLA